jgi:hypothetical protein
LIGRFLRATKAKNRKIEKNVLNISYTELIDGLAVDIQLADLSCHIT